MLNRHSYKPLLYKFEMYVLEKCFFGMGVTHHTEWHLFDVHCTGCFERHGRLSGKSDKQDGNRGDYSIAIRLLLLLIKQCGSDRIQLRVMPKNSCHCQKLYGIKFKCMKLAFK